MDLLPRHPAALGDLGEGAPLCEESRDLRAARVDRRMSASRHEGACSIATSGGRSRSRSSTPTRCGLFSRLPRSLTGRIVGTLPYLAPEQILGEPIDERADVYAVGVVLFELLTRRPPFVGSEYEVLVGHVERPPPRPREVAGLAGIPAAIERVVLTALAKRREERFPSALEFDAALVEAVRSEGIDVEATAVPSGCGEAQASLAAWNSFEHTRARDLVELAARLNRGWSPLRVLMSLVAEE